MANFAKAEFALSAKMEDGATYRDHLRSGWRQSGIKPAELNTPPLPEHAGIVWEKFQELHRARRYGMGGPDPITFPDIQAWRTVTGSRLEPWELRAILRLDVVYRAQVAARAKTGG